MRTMDMCRWCFQGDAIANVNVCDRHGNQGILDTASKGSLESEFGTSKDDDVVKQILEKGNVIETGVSDNPPSYCCGSRDIPVVWVSPPFDEGRWQ